MRRPDRKIGVRNLLFIIQNPTKADQLVCRGLLIGGRAFVCPKGLLVTFDECKVIELRKCLRQPVVELRDDFRMASLIRAGESAGHCKSVTGITGKSQGRGRHLRGGRGA